MEERLHVNSPNVMSETIEGEVIVINLATGTYYSLRKAGAAIWNTLEYGATPDEVATAVEARFDASRAEILDAVRGLLSELEDEGLVVAAAARNGGAEAPGATAETDSTSRIPFEAPVLEKFTDMQELILLDPVHEVGAAGWPHLPAEGSDRA